MKVNITKNESIYLARWVLALIVVKSIIISRYFALPVWLGLFALLFNIAQGKLIEGIIVGIFATSVMVFLLQIAIVRSLLEEGGIDSFIRDQIKNSKFSNWVIHITSR